jgi:hypothetical protein
MRNSILLSITGILFAQGAFAQAPPKEKAMDMSNAKMYGQLLNFKYDPSKRDPFINSNIISPYVSTEKQEETESGSKIEERKDTIRGILKKKIQIQGISYGAGTNYALGNELQILSPGKNLVLKIAEKAELLKLADEIGFTFATTKAGDITLEVLEIKRNEIIFQEPWDTKRDSGIHITYKESSNTLDE